MVCRNPANSFLMESPSGALNENTNGGSQLSAGGAGRWREVEKCGFRVTSPKMAFLDLILFVTCPCAKFGRFVRETYLCSLRPSIQWKNNWGKRTRLARVTSDSFIFWGEHVGMGLSETVLCMGPGKGVVHGARNGSRHGVCLRRGWGWRMV